jgi:hypothetical protein
MVLNVLSYRRLAHPVGGRNEDSPFVASDLFIDGKSLWEWLRPDKGFFGIDYGMSPLGPGGTEAYRNEAIRAMMGEPNTPAGRSQILVCEADGDPWCGVVSTRIEVGPEYVRWGDFAHERRDPPRPDWGETAVKAGLEFKFARSDYQQAVLAAHDDTSGPVGSKSEYELREATG